MNTTDPDSRVVRTHGQPPLQGYNAQFAVNDQQVVVAAETPPSHRTSDTSNRWSAPPNASYAPSTSPTPTLCSATPATGIAPDRSGGQ
jgi:hypothetical protein